MTTETLNTTATAAGRAAAGESRAWALAGVGAGLSGIAMIVASSMVSAVYEDELAGDAAAITARLAEQTTPIMVFHVTAVVSALLAVVFAAGLRRRLADVTGDRSLLPQVATTGLALVSVALLMGSALDTEFVYGVKDPDLLVPEAAVFFNHWVGTVPWVWAGAGLTALAVGLAGRRFGGIPRWVTWVSLGLGALTTLLAVSPLQYMAGATGALWLTVVALGMPQRR